MHLEKVLFTAQFWDESRASRKQRDAAEICFGARYKRSGVCSWFSHVMPAPSKVQQPPCGQRGCWCRQPICRKCFVVCELCPFALHFFGTWPRSLDLACFPYAACRRSWCQQTTGLQSLGSPWRTSVTSPKRAPGPSTFHRRWAIAPSSFAIFSCPRNALTPSRPNKILEVGPSSFSEPWSEKLQLNLKSRWRPVLSSHCRQSTCVVANIFSG